MNIGITGLPQSGKKTLFQILTNLDPLKNKVGVSRIKDPKLDLLNTVFKPGKVVLSEIDYSLLPDITKTEKEKDSAFRALLNLDSFIFIARPFKDDSVYHIENMKPKTDGGCDHDGAELIQRPDDNPEIVVKRLETYRQQTRPLVDHYKKIGIVYDYDANKAADEVAASVFVTLDSLSKV